MFWVELNAFLEAACDCCERTARSFSLRVVGFFLAEVALSFCNSYPEPNEFDTPLGLMRSWEFLVECFAVNIFLVDVAPRLCRIAFS
jgi:hypothetical protein